MKTITGKIIALAIAVSGIIFSPAAMAACNVPTGMNITAIAQTSATLNWTAPSGGAQSYNLRYRVVSTSTWTTATSTTVSKNITSLSAGTSYEWQVQSKCSGTQTSSWTASTTFSTLVVCNTPTGLSTSGITTSGATLNWTAVSGAAGYNIQYRVVGASTWTTSTSTSNSKTLTSLTASTNYEWQVQTNCGSSNLSSFSSSSTFSTPVPPCNTPTGLNTTGVTPSDATLNWSLVSGAIGYNVQYREIGQPSWNTTSTSSTSFALSGLTSVTGYEWKVQTNCGSSNLSAFSSVATFTTLTPPCGIPAGLSTSGITLTDVVLNWTSVAGALDYEIQYRVVGSPAWNSVTSGSTPSTISGLTPFGTYEWQVRSNCGTSNWSAYSASNNFTTSNSSSIPLSVFHGTWVGTSQRGDHIQLVLGNRWNSALTINGSPDHANNAILGYRLPEYNPTYIAENGPPSSEKLTIKFFTNNAIHGILAPSSSPSSSQNITLAENTVQQIYTGQAVVTLNSSGQYQMVIYVDMDNFSSVSPEASQATSIYTLIKQ